MTEQLRQFLDQQADELEETVRQALEICNGDPMAALRSAIIANTFLQDEIDRLKANISVGFARGLIRRKVAE